MPWSPVSASHGPSPSCAATKSAFSVSPSTNGTWLYSLMVSPVLSAASAAASGTGDASGNADEPLPPQPIAHSTPICSPAVLSPTTLPKLIILLLRADNTTGSADYSCACHAAIAMSPAIASSGASVDASAASYRIHEATLRFAITQRCYQLIT